MGPEPDFRWMTKDLREKLRERCELVKNKLLFHLDQGQGLTQEQLVELYADIEKLFPRRVRKSPDNLDAPL